MKKTETKNTKCGPVIACGAAAVSMDHEPGEPTSIDKVADAIRRFMTDERPMRESAAQPLPTVPAHEGAR